MSKEDNNKGESKMAIQKTFVAALKDYFGFGDGGLKGFRDEIKALTDKDKKEFAALLETVGYEIITK